LGNVTINDIAALAGVAKSTISRAINTPHLVHPETLQRIRSVMDEQHYVYDARAGELSSKKNKAAAIGLITPTIRLPAFAEMVSSVQAKAMELGYSVIILNSQYNMKEEIQLLNFLLQRKVAGVIVIGLSDKKKVHQFLSDRSTPHLFVWETVNDEAISYVGYDNFSAAYEMTEYLLNLKHQRIGLIIGPSLNIERIRQRVDGYMAALKKHNIAYDPSLVVVRNNTHIDGKEGAGMLLSRPNRPSAIFAGTSILVAIGALAGIKDKGLRVPEDVSIAALGDIEYAADCDPPITTVHVPTIQMGELSINVLIDMIENEQREVRQYRLNTHIIIRKSCCEPKQR
jgi:LacI family transcriptional regulator